MIRFITCPICNKEISAAELSSSKTLPFCSQRCRQIDFFRWSDGRYAIEESPDQQLDELGDLGDAGGANDDYTAENH